MKREHGALTDGRLGIRERLQHHAFRERDVVQEDIRSPFSNDPIDVHLLCLPVAPASADQLAVVLR